MKPGTQRFAVVLAICAFCTALFLVLWARGFVPLQELEFYSQDWQTRLGRKTPMDSRLVLIGIDRPVYSSEFSAEELQAEPALASLQRNFPWSRAVWARLIEKLGDAGAKVIVFDLVFAAPGDGDEQLHQALEKYKDRVVIGYNISETKTDRGTSLALSLPNSTVLTPMGVNSPVEDERLGYVNIWADYDGILRRANFRQTGEQVGDILPPNVVLESLDTRVLERFGRADLVPPGFQPRIFRYTAPPSLGYRPNPIGDVLSPKVWKQNYGGGNFFKDKIVFIGPTADIFHDEHDTPFAFPRRQMAGPEIHLNIINAALHGEFLSEPSMLAHLFIITLAGLMAAALSSWATQPLKRFFALMTLTAVYWLLAFKILPNSPTVTQVIFVLIPTVVLMLSSLIAMTYDYFLERREKRRVRKTLERYVSKDVVKELLDNPETFFNTLGGVRKPVTVLFSDVRGFTTLTENADSSLLVKQLNEYFEEMVRHVFAHHGSLDKFIGDAVMAVWGNIVSQGVERDAHQAVATALAMKRSLVKLNEIWKSRGWREFPIGIGINHGEVIVGNIGSSEKMEVTVVGDAVNLASRLEGLTKEYHLDLLLGESVAALVGNQFILRTVDLVQVKGKTKPVDVFAVEGDGGGQTVSLPIWLARYEEGVRLYRQRVFAEAARAFQECLRRRPEDYLSAMYLKRCETLIDNPPDESWNGVFVMTKK